jgi:hypothetical protein
MPKWQITLKSLKRKIDIRENGQFEVKQEGKFGNMESNFKLV